MTLHYPRENVKFAVGQVRDGDSNYCRNGYLYSHTSLKNIILKLFFKEIPERRFPQVPFAVWNNQQEDFQQRFFHSLYIVECKRWMASVCSCMNSISSLYTVELWKIISKKIFKQRFLILEILKTLWHQ